MWSKITFSAKHLSDNCVRCSCGAIVKVKVMGLHLVNMRSSPCYHAYESLMQSGKVSSKKNAVVHQKRHTVNVGMSIVSTAEFTVLKVISLRLFCSMSTKTITMSVFIMQAVRDGARQVATAEQYLNSLQVL